MAKLGDIVNHPNYTAAATSASKGTIFVFIATFFYLVFFSGVSPGLIGGTAFFFAGIFVVSFSPIAVAGNPFVVVCREPIPEFRRGFSALVLYVSCLLYDDKTFLTYYFRVHRSCVQKLDC